MSWIRWIREAEQLGRILRRQAGRLEGLAAAAEAGERGTAKLAAADAAAGVRASHASIQAAEGALADAVARMQMVARTEGRKWLRQPGQLGYVKPAKRLTAAERQAVLDVKAGTFTLGGPAYDRAARKGLIERLPHGGWVVTREGWIALGTLGAAAVLAFLPTGRK